MQTRAPMLFIAFILLFSVSAAAAPTGGSVSRGSPKEGTRTGAMMSAGERVRAFISSESGPKELMILFLIALAYGTLHALGPGHQKTLVSGYLLAEGGGIPAAIAASGVAAASHAASVIGIFAVLTLLGTGFGVVNASSADRVVTLVSGALAVVFSALLLWRKIAALVAAIRVRSKAPACACGHHHGEPAEPRGTTKARRALSLLIAGSLAPCPGAALFLLYGFNRGNPLAGVLAVVALSLGMWVTLIAVGVISVAFRAASIAGSKERHPALTRFLPHIFGVAGACAILAFSIALSVP